jgi:hypothetical protein
MVVTLYPIVESTTPTCGFVFESLALAKDLFYTYGMFREDKSTQLAAYLIKKSGGRCNYLTLIKMMYDADRQMVLTWGTPIVFDTWILTKAGPVLGATYDQINPDSAGSAYWSTYVTTTGCDVKLISDPGDDALSDAEIEAADNGFRHFYGLTYNQEIDRAHELFNEWTDPESDRLVIGYEDVLRSNGQGDPEYLNEVRTHCQLNSLLAR